MGLAPKCSKLCRVPNPLEVQVGATPSHKPRFPKGPCEVGTHMGIWIVLRALSSTGQVRSWMPTYQLGRDPEGHDHEIKKPRSG